jgi:hypothetical protein
MERDPGYEKAPEGAFKFYEMKIKINSNVISKDRANAKQVNWQRLGLRK